MVWDIVDAKRVSIWKKFNVIYQFFLARRIIPHFFTFFFYCAMIPMSAFFPEVEGPKWGMVYVPTAIAITLMNAVGTPRSFHLIIFWVLFENVMSLHRCKAVFIGLFEAGRVNEWVVTEKLGYMLETKPNSVVPNKLQMKAWERLNGLEIVVGLCLLVCPCYDCAFGKGYIFVYSFPQSIAFLAMGFGYIGTITPTN